MTPVTIVVPVYKETLTKAEAFSLKQLVTVLGSHPIQFLTHKELDLSAYSKIVNEKSVDVCLFDKQCFRNVFSYNKLLLSKKFYERFTSEYILIYQLDAWVFRDELLYWCKQGYDYIGAPWYHGFENASQESQFFGIGNGGFSLRKVASHRKVLSRFSFVHSFDEVRQQRFGGTPLTPVKAVKLVKDFLFANNTFHRFNNYAHNEDVFWGLIAPQRFSWYTVPDELTAARFSMEVNAPFLYRRLENMLPFGCHAWEKYSTDFWSSFIHPIRLPHEPVS